VSGTKKPDSSGHRQKVLPYLDLSETVRYFFLLLEFMEVQIVIMGLVMEKRRNHVLVYLSHPIVLTSNTVMFVTIANIVLGVLDYEKRNFVF